MERETATVPEVHLSNGPFPYGFRRELRELFKLAWPTSLSIMFHQLIQPISLMFVGHIGKTELAGVALGLSWIYIWVVSLGRGLAFAGDTFFSQTYGSANKTKVGVYLQRAVYFAVLVSCPILAVLLNTESLLLLIRIDPAVAKIADEYCILFTPGVVAYAWLFTIMRYLLCQNRVIGNLIITIVSCGICSILHYGLVIQADMGIKGSAISLMLTYYLTLILLVSYIWGSGLYKETWDGWSFEAFTGWGEFATVAIPSLAMTYVFWLCTEIGTFLAGLLGDESISAYSIMWQVEGFAWMVPLGLGGACTARIGQYLGSNQPLGAVTVARVTLSIQVVISVVMAGLTYALKDYIPMMFTSNKDLIDYTASLMPFCAAFLLLEGFGGVGVGIVRGTGRQAVGTVILLVSYYIVALPVGIPLMFLTYLGLAGIWWGNDLGLFVQDLCLVIFVLKMNWRHESDKAMERAGIPQSISNGNIQRDEVDENTRLLGNHPAPELSSSLNDSLAASFSDPQTESRSKLIFKRACTFVVFFGIVAIGVLLRLYVHVPVTWKELCIPTNDTLSSTGAQNVTLPPCTNDTVFINYPPYAIWV